MKNNPAEHSRRSIRLGRYDYAQSGLCIVTICVSLGECLLGQVVSGKARLSVPGQIAVESWMRLEQQYRYVVLDAWAVMLNHIHSVIGTGDTVGRGTSQCAPTQMSTPTKLEPLGGLIGAFKTASAKHINRFRGSSGERFWQRNYCEHIIRNERDLTAVRQYIRGNPANWNQDIENPHGTGKDPT